MSKPKKPICPPNAKLIKLTKGYWAIVDAELFNHLSQFSWVIHKTKNSRTHYAQSWKAGSMHRYIWRLVKGEEPPLNLDHINGLGYDNRICNLRPATQSQNCANVDKQNRKKKGHSAYKGVTKDRNRWRARIRYQNKLIDLGHYTTEFEASRAYDLAAIKYFGEFARTNHPRDEYNNAIPPQKHKRKQASNFRGVSWCVRENRWRVYVYKDRKAIYVGQFKNETEAARAYDKKAIELFGQYASLNFPNPQDQETSTSVPPNKDLNQRCGKNSE